MCLQPAGPKAGSVSASATSRPRSGPDSEISFGFPPERRVRKRSEFRAVYDGGARVGTKLFTVFVHATGSGLTGRVGLTVTRKVGNSVARNRCKRFFREAVRKHWDLFPDGVDVVLHARAGLAEARAEDVEYGIVRMLPKAVRRLV